MSLLLKWGRELLAELGVPTRQDVLDQTTLVTSKLEAFMADVSPLLNQLTSDISAFATGPFQGLLDDNAAKAARITELEAAAGLVAAEDAREESAATAAVTAFNALTAPLTDSPDVPGEVPVVDEPAPVEPTEPGAEPTPGGEPAPVEPGAEPVVAPAEPGSDNT